jgi:F-type H+-transporting ATPase subunit delta
MKTIKQTRREAKQLFRLCLVNGLLDEGRVRLVAQSLLGKRRRGSLALLSHFLHRVKLERARHTAEVQSAIPLAADLQASVLAGLVRLYGAGVTASFTHEPSLIGGMRVKVGSDVYDGSIRGALETIERSF